MKALTPPVAAVPDYLDSQKISERSTGVTRAMSAPASQRTQVRRAAARGSYEAQHIYSILDEGLVAHVGLVQDGSPFVIPMGYARKGNQLLLHGSISSRLMKVQSRLIVRPCCHAWMLTPFAETNPD